MSSLGLGTVQFGLPYGITNQSGQLDGLAVSEILREAARSYFVCLDMAQSYGNSEEVLGQRLAPEHGFRIVTKTMPIRKRKIDSSDADRVRGAFFQNP